MVLACLANSVKASLAFCAGIEKLKASGAVTVRVSECVDFFKGEGLSSCA